MMCYNPVNAPSKLILYWNVWFFLSNHNWWEAWNVRWCHMLLVNLFVKLMFWRLVCGSDWDTQRQLKGDSLQHVTLCQLCFYWFKHILFHLTWRGIVLLCKEICILPIVTHIMESIKVHICTQKTKINSSADLFHKENVLTKQIGK